MPEQEKLPGLQYVKNGHIKGGSGKYVTRIVTADDVGAKNDKETLSDFVKAAAVGIENFFCDADLWCAEGEGPITTRCPIPKLGLYLPLMRCPDGVWKSTPRQHGKSLIYLLGLISLKCFKRPVYGGERYVRAVILADPFGARVLHASRNSLYIAILWGVALSPSSLLLFMNRDILFSVPGSEFFMIRSLMQVKTDQSWCTLKVLKFQTARHGKNRN